MKKVLKSDKDFFVLILPFTERRTAEDKKKQPKSGAKKKLRIFNIYIKKMCTQKNRKRILMYDDKISEYFYEVLTSFSSLHLNCD